MDDLLFALKRAHLAGNRWALGLLAKLGVTPARFDLMRMLFGTRDHSMAQHVLRARLGVARSTISRMLRSLEQLGWIERKRDPFDRRTRICTLTYAARSIVWNILSALVRPRVVADALDAALRIDPDAEPAAERKAAVWFCKRVVWKLATPRDSVEVRLVAC